MVGCRARYVDISLIERFVLQDSLSHDFVSHDSVLHELKRTILYIARFVPDNPISHDLYCKILYRTIRTARFCIARSYIALLYIVRFFIAQTVLHNCTIVHIAQFVPDNPMSHDLQCTIPDCATRLCDPIV